MAWGSLWIGLFCPTQWRNMDHSPNLSVLGLTALSVDFGSVIAFACYFVLIDRIGAQKTVFIGVITP